MNPLWTVALLVASNVFMTAAWYWHVRDRDLHWPLPVIILISWLLALPEYCLAVPANRFGSLKYGGAFTTPQLKIIQEGITLTVFVAFSMLVLRETPRWQEAVGMLLIFAGVAVALSGRS
jgi:uncharacterized protein (DUF486 family)